MKLTGYWRSYCLSVLLGSCLLSGLSYADDLRQTLPPVTVYPENLSLTRQINQAQVLEAEDIGIAHERSITEVLQGMPSISTNTSGYGQQSSFLLRGTGGQGVVTLDGIPIFASFPGLLNLDVIPPESLQKMELVRGPDAAYQSFQALGGSLKLYSKDSQSSGAKLSVEGGSFGIVRETLQGSLAGTPGRVSLTLSRGDAFDGSHLAVSETNPEREPFRFTGGILHFGTQLGQRLHWEGSMLYRKSRIATDKLGEDNRHRVVFRDDPQSFDRSETWLAQNTLKLKVTEHWLSDWQLGYTQLNSEGKAATIQTSIHNRLYLVNMRNQHTLVDDPQQQVLWQIHWGGQVRHEQGEAVTPFTHFAEERSMETGFLSTEARYGVLSGELGARVEHYAHFGDHPLFKAAIALKITPSLTLRTSGGTGYRVPSYTELLTLFFGNPALQPERSASADVGLEWSPTKALQLNLKGYYSRFDNLITQAYEVQNGLTTHNVSDARITGMELDGQYAYSENFSLGLSYAYTDTQDINRHTELPFRPAHTARLWGEQRFKVLPISLWAEMVARGAPWSDPATGIALNHAVQFNTAVRYRVSNQVELYVRGENLSNNRAQQVYGIDKPGIAVYGGIQLQL